MCSQNSFDPSWHGHKTCGGVLWCLAGNLEARYQYLGLFVVHQGHSWAVFVVHQDPDGPCWGGHCHRRLPLPGGVAHGPEVIGGLWHVASAWKPDPKDPTTKGGDQCYAHHLSLVVLLWLTSVFKPYNFTFWTYLFLKVGNVISVQVLVVGERAASLALQTFSIQNPSSCFFPLQWCVNDRQWQSVLINKFLPCHLQEAFVSSHLNGCHMIRLSDGGATQQFFQRAFYCPCHWHRFS